MADIENQIDSANDDDYARDTAGDEWWLANLGRLLVWSRLRILESGVAEVFDCDGRINIYESPDILPQHGDSCWRRFFADQRKVYLCARS
jgi:hypothetical protein